jgi:hypothetical protein
MSTLTAPMPDLGFNEPKRDSGKFLNHLLTDPSSYSLLAANIITLILALVQHWSLIERMLTYWVQSVIIGFFHFLRILNLKDFDVKGFEINDRPVTVNPSTKQSTAIFFLIHYGIFHTVYLMFLLSFGLFRILLNPANLPGSLAVVLSGIGTIALNSIVFFVNHLFSYRYNLQRDQASKPNIGRLMFFPYARILPMHLTIIFGGAFLSSGNAPAGVVIFFLSLKTLADLIMHGIEHKI